MNKHNQRQKARRHLPRLLAQQGGRCYWCPRQLVLFADIQRRFPGAKRTSNTVTWVEDGVERSAYFATTDHVAPLSDGGQNHRENLAAACADCNKNRTATKSPKTLDERQTCPKCGRPKPTFRRKCDGCRKGYDETWQAFPFAPQD